MMAPTILSRVILETIFARGHLALTSVLSCLYLPLPEQQIAIMIAIITIVLVNGILVILMVKPGGSGAASVDVDVYPIALVGGRHEHVLTRVVAWMITLKCNHKVKVRLNLTKKLFFQ